MLLCQNNPPLRAHSSRTASPGPFRERESDIFFPSRWILPSRRFRLLFFFFLSSRARLTPSLGLRERVGPRLPRRHVDFACAPPTFWRRALTKSATARRHSTRGSRAEKRSGAEKRAFPAALWCAVAQAAAPEAITKSAAAPATSARRLPRRGASRKNTARRRPVVLCEASSMAARFVDCLT